MGPKNISLFKKAINFDENHEIANKNIKGIKSLKDILPWFCDKDLSSLDSIN